MIPPLCVQATGMCCAVGHSTAAAAVAIGACIDHFRLSWFCAEDGTPLPCASVWNIPAWGPERMGILFASVLEECREQVDIDPQHTALLLVVSDPKRPGVDVSWSQAIYAHCTQNVVFHEASRICPWDRAGIGSALIHARELLTEGTVKKVIVVGVDSYLNAVTIDSFLEAKRLLTEDISDGFIPGEGAGAVVLGLAHTSAAEPGVRITGVGIGHEEATILQDTLPNRGHGLVTAIRAAVKESGHPLVSIQFELSDGNGNSYYSSEASIAMMRTLEHRVAQFPFLLPASNFGETGAAVGPLMLAYLTRFMPREGYTRGLVHCGADTGARTAIIVDYA